MNCFLLAAQRFNSSLVRLKDAADIPMQAGAPSFNSSLVRLKAEKADAGRLDALFQFQLGAIKGRIRDASKRGISIVSIPAWCD